MHYETVDVTLENNIATVLLNRPKRFNSFNLTLCEELYESLSKIGNNTNIRAVVIKGSGKGFCGGGDVKEMYEAKDKSSYLRSLSKAIQKCLIEIRTMQKPVIAAVHGAALGAGLSLVMACDLVIAVEGVKFNSAFITIGLAPGCGTHFLTRLFGYQRACELVLTAKTFTAEEAFEVGFVNKIVKEEEIKGAIEEYVSKFRTLPPLAVGMAKMLLNESMHNDLHTHHELESKTASRSAASKDFEEGVRAFVEKRKALFRGI